mmetsp:Transcript_58634/g.134525  ORF Transcript_58634/g.134525 Transcript_58634/m.134525 type:complete len:279 (-) Transcript_58634:511-1347(-)
MGALGCFACRGIRLCVALVAHRPAQTAKALHSRRSHPRAHLLLPLHRAHWRCRLCRSWSRFVHADRQGGRARVHVRPLSTAARADCFCAGGHLAASDRVWRRAGLGVRALIHLGVLLWCHALQPRVCGAQYPLARIDGQAQGREHDARESLRCSYCHVLLVRAAAGACDGGAQGAGHVGRRHKDGRAGVHPQVHRDHRPLFLPVQRGRHARAEQCAPRHARGGQHHQAGGDSTCMRLHLPHAAYTTLRNWFRHRHHWLLLLLHGQGEGQGCQGSRRRK